MRVRMLLVVLATACSGVDPLDPIDEQADIMLPTPPLNPGEQALLVGVHQDAPDTMVKVRSFVEQSGGLVHSFWPDLSAMAVHIPAEAVAALQAYPLVEYVEEDRVVHASTIQPSGEDPYGNVAVRAPEVRAAGVTGAGITVCIIDTGIDAGHPEFQRSGGVFTAGFDFVDGDSDPCDCDAAGNWGVGHGTHVTGTVVAQLGVGGLGGPSANGTVGVAPGVNVAEYRVLDLTGSGTTAAVINGLNACKALPGKRIASLSLGSSQKSRTEQLAFDSAYAAGVLTVAAAGNDGNKRTGYPAGYASVISVAAVDANLAHAAFSQTNNDVELSGPGVSVWSSLPRGAGLGSSVSAGGTAYDSNPLEFSGTGSMNGTLVNCGLCDSATSCGGSAAGFVAYCDRGVIAFSDKHNNAKAQGASAVIIGNNDTAAPDDSGSFTLGAAGSWLPSASVSLNSGTALKAAAGSAANVTVGAGDYARWDGTSMATPHVSACAALAWSNNASFTNANVRSRLAATAKDLGAAGRDNLFGYGLVDCYRAAIAP